MVYLTNYNYRTSVLVLERNDSEYKVELDEYIKETITQSNVMRLNNFGKYYKIHAEVFKQQNKRELELMNVKINELK